jgi:hypothetical protein
MSNKKTLWLLGNRLNIRPGSFRDYYAKVYSAFQFPVDRFNFLPEIDPDPVETVNIVPEPRYNLANLTSDWQDRYFSICDQVAESVYVTAGTRTILLLYSGGIDSTAVLVALMRSPRYQEFKDQGRLVIGLTSFSIYEYPEFFYQRILPELPIIPADYNTAMADAKYLVVTGDAGDYVIGNTDCPIFAYNGTTDVLDEDKSVLYPYINSIEPSGKFSHLLQELDRRAPFDIVSINQLYWWLGQCFTHQGEMCYPWAWSGVEDITELASFNKLYRFFLDERFVTFGFEHMSTNPSYPNLRSHRTFPKRYIVGHTGHQWYLNKNKIMSQRMTTRKWYKSAIYSDLTHNNETSRVST